MINETVYKQYFTKQQDWQQCQQTNSSYVDCFFANNDDIQKDTYVAVHNPSSMDMSSVKVNIPKSFNYNVL